MILRYDRVGTVLPPPSDPDPEGAAAVQELMGGRFGEMSTFIASSPRSINGPHPETGEDLVVIDEAPEGEIPRDLPAQPAVFAPDVDPGWIAEIREAKLGRPTRCPS